MGPLELREGPGGKTRLAVGGTGLIAIVGGVAMGDIGGEGDRSEPHSTGMALRLTGYCD